MGLIFNIPTKSLDTTDPTKAIQQIWKYVQSMQEQLEYTLLNLDSSNITEISTDKTVITDGSGNSVLTGDSIALSSGKYSFKAGVINNAWAFEVTDSSGNKVVYMSNGELVISRRADMTIDGGTW